MAKALTLTTDNIQSQLMPYIQNAKDTLPALLIGIQSECTVGKCARFNRDLNKVADIVKRQNKLMIVNCGEDQSVCQRIPFAGPKNGIAITYLRDKKFYEYQGEQS